ncbi:MAG: ABC transporter substrate-binding protein [Candidatus Binatia bacterium]
MKSTTIGFARKILLYSVSFQCTCLLVFGAVAESQPAKLYRVGVLVVGGADIPQINGLRDGLKAYGYIQGRNLDLEIAARETYDEYRPLVKSYKEKNVDVLVTIGGTATRVVKDIAPEIPTVFSFGSDPVQAGFIKSIARPESNLTGVTTRTGPEFQGKRLEIFKEAVPTLRRVAVLYNARGENPGHEMNLKLLRESAPKLDIKLISQPVKTLSGLDASLQTLSKDTMDGVFVIGASLFRTRFNKIVPAATQKKLPVMGNEAFHVTDDGALLSYDSDRFRIGQRLAWYVDRILKGTKPRDLPVEAPTHFDLMINLKTAKQIGLTIPQWVLMRADRVIK